MPCLFAGKSSTRLRFSWLPCYSFCQRPGGWDADAKQVLAKNPNDFAYQYAYALSGSLDETGKTTLLRLDALNGSYSDNPAVLAAMLRIMTHKAVKIQRGEEEALLGAPMPRVVATPEKKEQIDPEQVAKFIALAQAGERLEPHNALFSILLAEGYFAAKDDDKAIAAWVRAGEKTEWNDHTSEEIVAKWNLQRALNNNSEAGAIPRMTTIGAILFPHHPGIRASARMATVMAMQAEQRGDKETGFGIRRATRRIGQNIENNGKVFLANLVGRAIVGTAMSRAGGGETPPNPYKGKGAANRWAKERQGRYAAYLRSVGHPEEADAFTQAIAEGEKARTVWNGGISNTYMGLETKTYQLFGAWCADFLLIAGVVFSVGFAGIFKLIYRFSPRLQKGEPLQPSARWGVAVGLVTPLLLGGIGLSSLDWWLEPGQALLVAAMIGFTLLVLVPLSMRLSVRAIGHGLLVLLATLASIGVLIGVGALTVSGLLSQMVSDTWQLFHTLSPEEKSLVDAVRPWAIGGLVLSVPLALLALFAVFSKILRVPVAAGVTRGMRAMAIPLACVLALLWSGSLVYTAKHEHAAIAEMNRIVEQGEVQYMARLAGQPLPN